MFEILRYSVEHEDGLIRLMTKERDWDDYTNSDAIAAFKRCLLAGQTLIGMNGPEYCGYVRAITDGFDAYVSELYVAPAWRNRGYGRRLLEAIKAQNVYRDIYVLSDEDAYYEKLGHRRIGSVFQL